MARHMHTLIDLCSESSVKQVCSGSVFINLVNVPVQKRGHKIYLESFETDAPPFVINRQSICQNNLTLRRNNKTTSDVTPPSWLINNISTTFFHHLAPRARKFKFWSRVSHYMIREMGKCRGCRKKMLPGGGKLQRVMFAHNKKKGVQAGGTGIDVLLRRTRGGNLETMWCVMGGFT